MKKIPAPFPPAPRTRTFPPGRASAFLFFSLAVLFPLSGPARAADLWTYHNDTARTGWNQAETILSPADVNAGGFGKLFSDAVDGQVYAQPLYASGVTVNGAVRNVVYVVTEHDSAYAFDADAAGVTLWHDNFTGLLNGVTVTTVSAQADLNGCAQITPEVGITDTPVLDLSNGTLYFVAFTKEVSAGPATAFVHRLHALDMATGAERPGSPVSIAADVTGQFPGGAAGDVFEARPLKERSGLLLENGVVYISFSSHCDDPSLSAVQNYHGWAMGYDADTLRQTAALNVTPYGGEGSIWGGAPLADAGGNIYMGIGNGSFDPPNHNWGDSILRLDASLGVQGYFTPSNQQTLNDNDWDVASVGLALLPPSFGNASHPNLITGGNKSGTVYLMDAADLGGYAGTLAGTPTPSAAPPDNIVQEFQPVGPAADLFFGIPACFSDGASNYVYWSFNGQPLSAYTLAGAQYDTTASSRTAETYPYPGCVPSVSSNGTSNGIVWTLQMNGSNPAVLHAYDATNLANELYNSGQNPSRDQAAPGVKWAPPSVVNGKVYVPTSNSLVVYGLLTAPSTTPTSPPQLSIPTATFTPAPSDTPTPSPTSANDLYAQWVQATADAASGQRVNHQALWFNNRLWVIGGSALVPSGNFQDVNDVWSSTDGSNWTQATASAAFPAREGFGAVTFNNQMWVLGGVNTNGTSQVSYNDAWSSSDGVSWTQAASAAPWIARSGLTATVFNGRIWVIGGYDNSANTLNDVWSSSDGVNWTQAAASAAFSTRAYHETVSWNGQLWLLGGEDEFGDQFNDVWSSSDGSNWTQAATAPWAARSEQSGLVFQNQLFVIGGWDEAQGEALNDVYHSSDGVNWTLSTSAAPFPSRYEAPAVTDGSRIWVLQGQNTAQTLSDAWFSPPTALSPTPSPTGNTALPTSTPTASPTASPTPSPSGTPTLSPTGTPSPTGTSTPTGISTSGTVPATPTWTPTATLPPAPSVTPAPTPTSGGDLYAQWAQATADAASNQRVNHQALWFNNRLWVIGGNALNSAGTFQDANDVWSSPDGSNWTRATASAAFPAREGFGAVVFNNQMWVLGGADHNNGSSQRYNDVWSSSDGVNWTQATAAAPWAARSGLGAAVLNGRIWVIAGTDASGSALNDAWSSPDGANWTQATSAAAFPRRTYHQAAAWNNRLWVLNGHNEVGEQFNDIWSSPDGAAWTPVETGPWSKRSEGSAVVFQGQLFIIGGWNEAQGTALNDVYHSSDGVNWTLSTSAAPFPPRYQAPAVADGNRIWVLQGQNTTQTLSDAWYSPAAATALVTPVTSPSTTTALSASTPTASPTASPTTTPTFTATRTSTPGATGTSPATGTSTPTAMASPSSTDSATPSPSPASTAASSPTASPTSTPSATPTLTATPSPTATPTPTPSPTAFPAIQPTPTPLPVCIGNGGLTSPKLNLQMACSSLGSQSQDFTVKITNEGAQPVTLADLSVVVWLNESGAENMDQFTATAGQTCGPGGFPCNNVVLSGQATSHGPVAACAGAPGHSANQAVTFNFGSGSTFTLPPNGGYYQSQNGELRFGRNNPSMDGGTWSDDYSHLGSGTGCPDSAFHDSPFYALLDNGQLVQETADTAGTLDPATGMVPCQTPVTYGTPLSPPQPYTPAALVEGGTPVAANLFTAPVLYPNPYRGAQKTTLQITLSRTSDISVEFLTVAYHEVSRKVFNGVPEGVQNLPLDAVDDGGSPLANGLYYVVMMATPTNGGRAQKFVGKWLILR